MGKDMIIGISSDHGGFELKQKIHDYLVNQGYEIRDMGCFDHDSVDYPDYAILVGEGIKNGEIHRGIIICGTGIGISISANKIPGVRAALCHDVYTARMSREHNNANILALGGRTTGKNISLRIVEEFMTAKFAGGRHERRVDKIRQIEEKYKKS